MDMLQPLSQARWISAHPACQSPIITRTFTAEAVTQATLFITGLGYFEAKINGQPITDARFLPLVTDYEPRDLTTFLYPLQDHPTHRIYYCQFDVTSLLQPGENVLTVQLGNGWYRQTERIAEGELAFSDRLKTIFSLYITGSAGETAVHSDGSETWQGSEIVYNQLFIGEVIDPTVRIGRPDKVTVLPDSPAPLCPQIGTPDRVIRTLTPRCIRDDGVTRLYDAGENISGVVRIRTDAPFGSRIHLEFAEVLDENGDLSFDSLGGRYTCTSGRCQIMTDTFVSDGTPRVFEPKFIWHAFRYFTVTGPCQEPEVLVIHSDTPVTARFDSPSEGLNFLFDAYVRTQLNNMHGSIPSDCPHRERLGYTGDGQVTAKAAMLCLDSREFYRKWIWDILDCQDPATGHVQHTAPLMGGGGGPGGWGCAIVLVPYTFYKHYGETELLTACYGPMRRWVEYLRSHSENGLIVREEEKGWCLGDWCPLEEPPRIPEPYVNSCYFLKILEMLTEIAPVVGHPEDITEYAALREEIAQGIRERYCDPGTGCYAGNHDGADAYALWAGLAGRETADRMAQRYDALGHFDTGFLGTDILMEMLCKWGHADTALKLLEGEEPGSFLYMKRRGATTIWENWLPTNSLNHHMFGGCTRQLFTALLGIDQLPGSAGYRQLHIAPQIPAALPWAEGSVRLPVGEVRVRWERQDGRIRFDIRIPGGADARFTFAGQTSPLNEGNNTFTLAI